MAYFRACSKLQTLRLVPLQDHTTWRALRLPDLSVHSVYEDNPRPSGSPYSANLAVWEEYNRREAEYMRRWREEKLTLDGDGFPKMLSFPAAVLHWQEWLDPLKFGFTAEEGDQRVSIPLLFVDDAGSDFCRLKNARIGTPSTGTSRIERISLVLLGEMHLCNCMHICKRSMGSGTLLSDRYFLLSCIVII